MARSSPVLLSLLTALLITITTVSGFHAPSPHSDDSFSQAQVPAKSVNIYNANDAALIDTTDDTEDNRIFSLSRHAYPRKGSTTAKTGSTTAKTGSTTAKTGSTHARAASTTKKTPSRSASRNKKSKTKARSSGGVTASAASSGTLVVALSKGGKRCVTIKKPCGTTCSPDSKSVGMCSGRWKPKHCFKLKRISFACQGKKVKMCKSTEKVANVCEKKVKKNVRCPERIGKRTVCAYPKVKVYSCRKLPPRCSKLRKKKCRYENTSKTQPCSKPKRPCRECFNNTAFKKCKATVTRKVEVPCGDSDTSGSTVSITPRPHQSSAGANNQSGPIGTPRSLHPSPSSTPSTSPVNEVDFFDGGFGYDGSFDDNFDGFDVFDNGVDTEQEDANIEENSATPLSFGNAQENTRSVQCFASLFNEEDCKLAPPFCQLFDQAFDSDKCTREVCRECELIKNMQVGREVRDYCRDLRASCHFLSRMLVTQRIETAATAHVEIEKSSETRKCYRNETKTIVVPCNYRLPKSEVCMLGCRIGKCKKIEKKRVSRYCRGHLPKNCYKSCSHRTVKRKVCHQILEKKRSNKVCKRDTKVKYRCYKNKTVKKPCKDSKGSLCSKLHKIKYVCGKVASKFGKCTGAKGEKKCRTKMCVQKKCS